MYMHVPSPTHQASSLVSVSGWVNSSRHWSSVTLLLPGVLLLLLLVGSGSQSWEGGGGEGGGGGGGGRGY